MLASPVSALFTCSSSRHDADTVVAALIQSLGVGQLHWAPPLGWQEEAYWTGLAELKAAGRIREVGLSNYGPKGVTRAHRYLANLDTQLASNQVRRLLTGRGSSSKALDQVNQVMFWAISV